MNDLLSQCLCVTALILGYASVCHSYFINVDASSEECFFEAASRDSKMTLTYEVADGGFLDIDVNVSKP